MDKFSDEELLKELKAGNEQAYRIVFEHNKPILLLEAYYVLRDPEEAEDIVQDAFIMLWNKKNKLNIQGKLRPYLLQVVRHACIDKLRHSKTVQKGLNGYTYFKETSTENVPIENQELGTALSKAIASITAPATRRAFELMYLEQKSLKEIAEEMNITVQVAKNQISRGLKILRERLSHTK